MDKRKGFKGLLKLFTTIISYKRKEKEEKIAIGSCSMCRMCYEIYFF